MPYDYDYFISYAHADNKSMDNKSGFVDAFVRELLNSEEHQQMFGRKLNVFFDKSEISSMSDWDNSIRSKLANSRFLVVLLSPGYFKSEYCAREFEWWMQHEMHRRMLGEGTAPMLIVDVPGMYDYQTESIHDIPEDLKARFPNWLKQIRRIQSGPKFDMHNLDRAKISDALDSLREEVKDRVRRQKAAEMSPHTGQYPQYNENFVGRREKLRSLRKSLSEKAANAYSALTGLGGFGKTELALTYGHAFAWDYQLGRVFANCENKTSISEALLTSGIAEMHGWELPQGSEDQQITFLFNHLNAKQNEIVQRNVDEGNLETLGAHILLILDNVNKRELISKKNLAILPDCFHVIITTRENTYKYKYIHTESVERLSEDESVELLNNLHPFASSEEAEAARKIAALLAGFTLAVELTGAYLQNNAYITYQKQYKRLVENHAETLRKMADDADGLTYHSAQTVTAVLESTLSALSSNACKALDYASVMHSDAVALGWIPELLCLDEDEGWNVCNQLTGYSLLTPLESEPKIARIHRLVADSVNQKIEVETRKQINSKIREKCNSLLENDVTFWCASKNSWNITPIAEFCLAVAEHWKVEASEENIDWGITEMLEKSGQTLKYLGKIDNALPVFKKFMKMAKERVSVFSSDEALRDLGLALSDLGEINFMVGNMDSAKDLHTQAYAIRKSIAQKQPNHVGIQCDLADSYKFLGDIYRDSGDYEKAKELYSEMLNISEKLKSIQDNNALWKLSISYERFGDLEIAAGKIAAARTWRQKALEIDKLLADRMPEDAQAQWGLSISYDRLGDLENIAGNAAAARAWCEKALEINLRQFNKMPKDVRTQRELSLSYKRLGDLEKDAGNTDAARTWFEKALAIDQHLSDNTLINVQTQLDLSSSYERFGNLEKALGKTDAARMWYEKALEIDQQLIDKMPENVQIKRGLSILYERFGDLEKDSDNISEAREWYKKELEINLLLSEKMQSDVKALHALSCSYQSFGVFELDAGNIEQARIYFNKNLEAALKLTDVSPDNVLFQRHLAQSYKLLGNLERAVNNIPAARDWYEKELEINLLLSKKMPTDVKTLISLKSSYQHIGSFELDAGNLEKTLIYFKRDLEVEQTLTAISPDNELFQKDLAQSYGFLGILEKVAGNIDSARVSYQKALEIYLRLVDNTPEDWAQRDLSFSYMDLGDLENSVGNTAVALELYKKALDIIQRLADKMPENVQVQNDLAAALEKLAQVKN